MQTSDKPKKIKDPVKAILAVVVFFLFSLMILGLLLIPYEYAKEQEFNAAIIGGSRPKWGIDAAVIREHTEAVPINLSIGPCAMAGRYDVLEGALDRYDLETVILEIGYDVFETQSAESWSVYNSGWIISRMVTLESVLKYCTQDAKIPWYEYNALVGMKLDNALEAWKEILKGDYSSYLLHAGSGLGESIDMSFTEEIALKYKNIHIMKFYYYESEIELFKNILQMCEDAGVRTIIVTSPLPESTMWYMQNWDEFRSVMLDTISGYQCEYYDYNLYKNRQKVFSDEESFRDYTHLSESGAVTFSELLSEEIINKQPDEIDPESLFYATYLEAKEHSRYVPQ